MTHLLSCRLLDEACTADDLAIVIDRAGKGMRPHLGEHCVKDTTEEWMYMPRSLLYEHGIRPSDRMHVGP